MQDTVEGYIDHVIFRNDDNGYTVLSLIVDGEELTCVGFFQFINEGETIEAHGHYTDHASYGQQFKIDSFETKVPEDAMAMERYLGSGAIKGVGAALAARIVRHFGEDTLRIMQEEPERLSEVKGISVRGAMEIADQMAEKNDMRKAMIFLQKYGISLSLGVKIYNQYGPGIYQVFQENPYRMAEDIPGVGFKIADEIAGRIGIHTDSDYRIRSGLLYVLTVAATEGHVYLPQQVLLRKAGDLLGIEPEYMEKHMNDMAIDRKITIKEMEDESGNPYKIIYANQYYYLELNTARMLRELDIICEENELLIEKRLQTLEAATEILLADEQRKAVGEAVKHGLMVLTGGPGTGKTTTINAIIQYFASEHLDILLAAPTGRAAKRMTEATGYEASTIHRLLEINGASDELDASVHFERNAQNPLEADVIIIDEMSMVDIHLMHALLSAIPVGTRLILVGDVNQLPSVGPGSVLRDIIESQCFTVVKLEKIFRQATQSDIVVNAHKINRGEAVILNNKSRDFFFLKRSDANMIISNTIQLIREKLPKYVQAEPFDIQVLTPMRKGLLGVERLNKILQEYLNPPEASKKEKTHGEGLFRQGDKVMQIKNDYQLEWEVRGKYGIPVQTGTGIFNGDMGIIREMNDFSETMTIEFDEGRYVEYSYKQLDELELAYAITIHKSQGSEYPAVILPLLGGPRMLMNRNLLYTAVTRACACVTIVGSEETFREMIDNKTEQSRYTTLDLRIREMI
ncbi:MAG: ATP-dependent RecD-like DNA helicase [Lachnospiraceae bacterium]|nr:ATP-dependent RecD-like DNA helicase [Lachnospiraceae bacterium]